MKKNKKESNKKNNITIVVSILALSTSVFFSVLTIIDKQKTNSTNIGIRILAEVDDLTNQFMDINKEIYRLALETPDANFSQLNMILNSEKQLTAEKIINKVSNSDIEFSSLTYANIAAYLYDNGEILRSKDFLIRAFSLSGNTTNKILICRNLAKVYNVQHTSFHSKDSSLHYRMKSIKLANDLIGDHMHFYKGESFQMWAWEEYSHGKIDKYYSLLDSAKREYSKISDLNPNKQNLKRQIEKTMDIKSQIEVAELIRIIEGKWNVNLTSKNLNGFLNINTKKENASIAFELYKDFKLLNTFSGNLISLNHNEATFQIIGYENQNVKTNFMEMTMPVQKSGVIKIMRESDEMKCQIIIVGEIAETLKLTKVGT